MICNFHFSLVFVSTSFPFLSFYYKIISCCYLFSFLDFWWWSYELNNCCIRWRWRRKCHGITIQGKSNRNGSRIIQLYRCCSKGWVWHLYIVSFPFVLSNIRFFLFLSSIYVNIFITQIKFNSSLYFDCHIDEITCMPWYKNSNWEVNNIVIHGTPSILRLE